MSDASPAPRRSAYARLVNRFSATPVGSWVARRTAARIDPWLYRRTGGRFTVTGPPTIPQLTLTTTGRRSGRPRAVQLAYLADGDDLIVVASNFGQEHHPAWMHNLVAHPEATVLLGRDERAVLAEQVSEEEKASLWNRLVAVVPQFATYVDRTDRTIRVFRLRPR